MKNILFIVFVLFFVACKSTKPTTESADSSSEHALNPEDVVFKIKKGGCFGTCPVYTLRIYKNAYAALVSEKNLPHTGTLGKQLTKETYSELKNAFEENKFMSFDDAYESNIPDLPLIKISYSKNGTVKTVSGKRERPPAIHKLQFLLENIAENSEGWTVIESDNLSTEYNGPQYDKSKVIVTIAAGASIRGWYDEVKNKYSVQLLKRLSNNDDTWLITYDTMDITPEEFLEALNNDPTVSSAEFQVVQK